MRRDNLLSDEPSVVSGVVHPHGAGGVMFGMTQVWTLKFAFETWRGKDGILNFLVLTFSVVEVNSGGKNLLQ